MIRFASSPSTFPLSAVQSARWFQYQWDEGVQAGHNIAFTMRCTGKVDVGVLKSAFHALLARHPMLRTAIREAEGQPFQITLDEVPARIDVVDAAGWSEGRLRERVMSDIHRPFDLDGAPLMRIALYRSAPDAGALAFTFDHLVCDGWSFWQVLNEFGRLLGDPHETESADAVVHGYRDYVVWQRNWLTGEVARTDEAFWRASLTPMPAPLALPYDRSRRPGALQRLARHHFTVRGPALERLTRLAQAQRCSLYPIVLTGFGALLRRYGAEEHMAIGTMVPSRERRFRSVVGDFANPVALTIRLTDDLTVDAALSTVRASIFGAMSHSTLPFASVVDALGDASSATGVHPIFQTALVFQKARGADDVLALFDDGEDGAPAVTWGGLALAPYGVYETGGNAGLDLLLEVLEVGDSLRCAFSYDAALFDAATIERLSAHWLHLLDGMADDGERTIGELPVPSPDETATVVGHFNATDTDLACDVLLHECFEAAADAHAGEEALTIGSKRLTYGALNLRANRLAHRLRAMGVGPGGRVAVCLERGVPMVVAVLGVLKAGGAYVPLDVSYPGDRLAYMLHDSQPVVLLTDRASQAGVPESDLPRIVLDVDDDAAWAETNPTPVATPTDLAYVIYTSGSTGAPKGAMNEHRAVVNRLLWARDAYGVGPGSVVLQKASFGFDVSVWELLLPLMTGARLVLALPGGQGDPAYLARVIAEEGITMMHFVPSMLGLFIEQADSAALPSLRKVLCSGEVLPRWMQDRFHALWPAIELHNLYGPTEAAIDVTSWHCTPDDVGDMVPIGRPIWNTRMYVLDERMRPVPIGAPGELYIGGAGVGRGYLGREALTSERFVDDPFSGVPGARLYRTGDVGRWRTDGAIEYLGRNDFQVKIRGFRIEPGEIEARLMAFTGMRDAAVMAVPAATGEPSLVAWYVNDDDVPTGALREWLATGLPTYMLPSALIALEAMPLTPNGKLDRKALPRLLAIDTRDADYEPPVGATEIAVVAIWSALLGLERIGRHERFLDLGGHSLLAARMLGRVRQDLGIGLTLREFFDAPTVAAVAAACGGQSKARIARTDRAGPLPLSAAQKRLWVVDRMDGPGKGAYHLPCAIRFDGELDIGTLRRSLDRVVARHEVLRTRFPVSEAGTHSQRIEPEDVGWPLTFHDVAGDATAVDRHMREEVTLPFDLADGRALRARLLRTGDTGHVLLLTLHHIITDGWSMSILVQEVSALYRAFVAGNDDPLPPLSVQYADYAAMENGAQEGEVDEALAFWKATLADAPSLLELPLDRPRPSVRTHAAGSVPFDLSAETTAYVRALAMRHDTTLFTVLLSAWAVVLGRFGDQTDVVIGAPVAHRPHPELEALVGFFVNSVSLRVRMDDAPSTAALLARVRSLTLDAFAHADAPFERVVEVLNPARSTAYSPIFQTTFALDTTPVAALGLAGLSVSRVDMARAATPFDVSLALADTGETVRGEIEYATDILDRDTVARMAEGLAAVLMAMADDALPVDRLPILAPATYETMCEQFNDTAVDFGGFESAQRMFERQVRLTPDALAAEDGVTQLTYAQLNQRAARLAGRLMALGTGVGDRVGICAGRGLPMLIAMLATLKVGACYVPLDPTYPVARVRHIVEDAAPRWILCDPAATHSLPSTDATVVALRDDADDSDADGLASSVEVLPADLAYIIYTSGSTGVPKGVMVEHGGLRNYLCWAKEAYAPSGGVSIVGTAFAFDATITSLYLPLLSGGAVHLLPSGDEVAGLERLLTGGRAWDLLKITPGHMAVLGSRLGGLGVRCAIRLIVAGGEPLPLSTVAQWRALANGVRIVNEYGPTETVVGCTAYEVPAGERAGRTDAPIGRPIANTRIHVLDAHGQPVPVGVTGEIHIGGAQVARGYVGRDDLTIARFPREHGNGDGARMYRTGDLARWLADGCLEYLGRNDHQVKIRGFRIETGEIEAVLVACDGVRGAAVVARPSPGGDHQLVAYVATDDREDFSTPLRLALSRRLPEYMMPSTWVRLDDLPLTTNGKIDRDALPAPSVRAEPVGMQAPTSEPERVLCAVWSELLGVPGVARHDRFFDMGGHSLMAIAMVDRVRRMGWSLNVRQVFATPCLADLASTMDPLTGDTSPSAVSGTSRVARGSRITPEHVPYAGLDQAALDTLVGSFPGGADTVADIYRLTPMQEGILLHHIIHTGADAYVLREVLAFPTVSALERFVDALRDVVARHDALRTSVHWQGLLHPVQVVHRDVPLSVERMPLIIGDDALDRLLRATDPIVVRFDLASAPLLRCRWTVDERTGEHYLALLSHHLVSDHVTVAQIADEVQAIIAGKRASLPPPLPYGMLVAHVATDDVARHVRYFDQTLGDVDEPTMPFDLSPADGMRQIESSLMLDRSTVRAIRDASRRHGVPVASLLHLAWAIVLSQATGKDDVVFGTVMSGRQSFPDASHVLGMFINTLPIRFRLGNAHVADVLRDSHAALVELLGHEHASLALARQCSRVAPERPLFTAAFNYRRSTAPRDHQEMPRIVAVADRERRSDFALILNVDDDGDALTFVLQCVDDLDPGEVARYARAAAHGVAMALLDDEPRTFDTIEVMVDCVAVE